MKRFTGLVIALIIAGCSVLPKPATETRFLLAPVQPVTSNEMQTGKARVLGVARPDVPVSLRVSQLVLMQDGEQTFYKGKAWSSPLPDMLDAALVRDLASSLPGWVVTGDNGVRKEWELQLEVHDFATVQDANGTAVVMNMDVRLVNPMDRSLIEALPYHYRTVLPQLTTAATIAAYNDGWAQLIGDVVTMLGRHR